MPTDYFPPIAYSGWWTVLAVVLVLVCVAWISWLFFSARRRPEAVVGALIGGFASHALRQKYLQRFSEIEHQYASDALTARAAHFQLSQSVREFSEEVSGVPATRMTLSELQGTPLRGTSDAVAYSYPFEFANDDEESRHGTVSQALARARNLVSSWN